MTPRQMVAIGVALDAATRRPAQAEHEQDDAGRDGEGDRQFRRDCRRTS